MQNIKSGYRPDIDGLRAIAVIAVILYHFKFGLVSGGFVGVDIFFVISGYLITKVILQQAKGARFDFADFYLRRVRRLIPALLTTVAVSYVAAYILFSPSDFKLMSGSAVYALTGISNIFFWAESGYFDAASSLKPLLHTWSLGVEIQFYIIWPIVLLLIIRFTKYPLVCLVLIALLGGVLSILYLNRDAAGAFFLTPLRVHEFLIGGIVVFLERYKISSVLSNLFYLIGISLIAYAIFFFNSESTLFPGLAALIPTCGAALMILGGCNAILAKPFSTGLAVKVGEISYSLYLVHWPLFVFVTYTLIDRVSTLGKLGFIAGSIGLALALYHLVEKPFRHQRDSRLTGAEFSLVTTLASVLILVPAASSWAQDGWSWRAPAALQGLGKIDERAASEYVFAVIKRLNEKEAFDASSKKEKLLVIGDSQAGDLLNILNEQGSIAELDVVSRLIDSACATPALEKSEEDSFFTRVNPIVIKQPEYIGRCRNAWARANDGKLIAQADKIFIALYWRDFAEPYYLEAIRKIASETKADVYVFGRKDLLRDSTYIATSLGRIGGLAKYAAQFKNPETAQINKPLALMRNVKYVDLMQATCPESDSCLVLDDNNKPVFFNATHLSREGARVYGPAVHNLIVNAKKLAVEEKALGAL